MKVRSTAPAGRPHTLVPEISVVVPARDEAENVAPLLEDVRAALEGRVDYEVVFVDDGSVDGTPIRLRELSRAFPRLRWVSHRSSCGQSAAIWTGVRLSRAPWIVTLDGDGQNDPADIPSLLEVRADRGANVNLLVNGRRQRRQDTWVKRTSSRIANGVRRRVLGDDTSDTGCGLKLFPREAFLALPFFDHMHRFLPALMRRGGSEIVSVPVRHRERRHGRSHYGVHNRLWAGIVDMLGVLWLQRRSKRPILAGPPSPAGDERGDSGGSKE
ncbi:MAG TPA: glycosyltransferase family 2 protein [Thermoanaerobaculia bacterium]|jgi:dolichol-phosphate mannosyltransferase|nr:glycosyltransferase family 2 protein [Thermoanaerobaculia bacterium]